MRPVSVPEASPAVQGDVLAKLYAGLSELYGRLAVEVARRGQAGPTEASWPAEVEGPPLTAKEAAGVVGRSPDWFGRHRGEFVAALVSRKGTRPRYSRRLLERQLELANRSRTRTL